MRMTMLFGATLLLVGGGAFAGDAKDDLAKLQGTWHFEKDGKKIEFKVNKDAFTFSFDEAATFKGTFKIDPSKKPKHMDLKIDEGPMFQGQTALAIYELDGDTLKWCADEPGKNNRAGKFPEKEGEGDHLYLIFKRAKK